MPVIDPTTAGFVAARAAHFGACLLLPAVFIFDRFVMTSGGGKTALWQHQWMRISRWLVLLALPMAILSGAVWLAFVSMSMNDVAFSQAAQLPMLRDVLSHSTFGQLWKLRSVLWVATAVTALPAITLRPGSSMRSVSVWLAMLCGAALAVTASRAGHGADGSRLHQFADAIHLLVGSAWPIGLVPLACLLFSVRKSAGLDKWIAIVPLIQRFSILSLFSVAVLSASGVVNSLALVSSWSDLLATHYGQTLLFKAGCLLAMIFLGAVNTVYLRPRLALDYPSSSEQTRLGALRKLQFNVWIEIGLGTAALIAAAFLGTLQPACQNCCCI